jgi:ubiquitin-conjugating enzyme E2 J1
MSGYNTRSPSVKRIIQEAKEMQQVLNDAGEDAAQFAAEALESDIFEWQFAIRGPDGSAFESGIYHGRIILPHDYPFKPPSFIMLTPSGRFETHTKICLSISSYHPEQWQPSWSMRTALTALIAFFPTPGEGALGSLTTSDEQRRRLAQESRCACQGKLPRCSTASCIAICLCPAYVHVQAEQGQCS